MKEMVKRKLFALTALCLCFVLSGCGIIKIKTAEPALTAPELTGTVTVGIAERIKQNNLLFPGEEGGDGLIWPLIHGMSTCALLDNGAYSYNKEVVKSMKWTEEADGGRTYTFTLKDDLTFSDGEPITAKDYLFGILLCCSPDYAGIGGDTSRYSIVLGHDDYAAGVSRGFLGLQLKSDYSFSLTVPADKLPYFGEYLELGAVPYPLHAMAPEAYISSDESGTFIENFPRSAFKQALTSSTTGYLKNPVVSAGPFCFVSYDRVKGLLTLSANPCYTLSNKPKAKELLIKGGISCQGADTLSFNAVDAVWGITDAQGIRECMELADKGKAQLKAGLSDEYYYLSFNCQKGATAKKSVRKAISCAVDPAALSSAFTGSAEGVLYGFAKPEGDFYAQNKDALRGFFPYRSDWSSASIKPGQELYFTYSKEDEALGQAITVQLTEAGFAVLSSYPEEQTDCGELSLKKGSFSALTVTDEGSKVLNKEEYRRIINGMMENPSTQPEKYAEGVLDYQKVLAEQLPAYPLFCLTEYCFYSERIGIEELADGKGKSFDLLSFYVK